MGLCGLVGDCNHQYLLDEFFSGFRGIEALDGSGEGTVCARHQNWTGTYRGQRNKNSQYRSRSGFRKKDDDTLHAQVERTLRAVNVA